MNTFLPFVLLSNIIVRMRTLVPDLYAWIRRWSGLRSAQEMGDRRHAVFLNPIMTTIYVLHNDKIKSLRYDLVLNSSRVVFAFISVCGLQDRERNQCPFL